MSDFSEFVDPNANFDELNPIREDAVRVTGLTKRGKECVLLDNTGKKLPVEEMQDILNGLIENEIFGFRTLSPAGGGTIDIDRRESTHVQICDDIYRLIVLRYEARIENF